MAVEPERPPLIEAGDNAHDFEISNQDGEPVEASDLQGKTGVLSSSPKAETPE